MATVSPILSDSETSSSNEPTSTTNTLPTTTAIRSTFFSESGQSQVSPSSCSLGSGPDCLTSGIDESTLSTATPTSLLNSTRSSSSTATDVLGTLTSSTSKASAETATTDATATSTASQASAQATSTTSKLSATVFAGTAVGCFVAGALLAALLTLWLSRKRSRHDRYDRQVYRSPHKEDAYIDKKALPMVAIKAATDLDFLPYQADDTEVKTKILNLADQIDQHVENFYTNRKRHFNATEEASLSSYETRQIPNPLATCFELATYPSTLIKHCLAYHVFSQTLAPGEDAQSMLPEDMASMVSAMYHKCLSPTASRETVLAFSSWKSLTGYLRTNLGRDTTPSLDTSEVASCFALRFSKAFSEWSNPQYSQATRVHHLAAVVDHAIETGIWLFRQPDGYRFSWNTLSHNRSNSIAANFTREAVIVPAVNKMTHKGTRLSSNGQYVMEAVVKRF